MAGEPDSFREELEPGIEPEERARLWGIVETLEAARPFPRAAFRAALRQALSAFAGTHERPPMLWARVAALTLPGIVLLALVAAGIGHSGPFAP
ncbi:MAG: hypothetical protein ABSC56_01660 [Solirubrobacteraceae bacterium]|jgi:hypothetical protein